ncbi:hypothetical protein BG006_009344 [Podila minutissima]|uniref:Uncharacterized protein n=1 Tax=Podila minutissima TaxID=64525 RepID=A0A9P5SEU5_9FUNG|nr:hypothetical protein BG006_009344 [Podila minutissima]
MPPSPPRYFPLRTLVPKRPELSNVVEGHNSASSSSSSSSSSTSSASSIVQSPPGQSSQPTVAYTGFARLPLDGGKPDGIWRGFSGEYTQKDWDTFSKNAQLEEKNKRQQSLRQLPPPSHSLSTSSSSTTSNSNNNSNNLVKLDYGGGTANIQLTQARTEDKKTWPAFDQAPPQTASNLEDRLLDLTEQDSSDKVDFTPPSALMDLLGLEFPVVTQEVIPDLLDLDINRARGAPDSGSLDGDEGEGDKYHVNPINGIDSISISDDDVHVTLVSDNSNSSSSNNNSNNYNHDTNIKIDGNSSSINNNSNNYNNDTNIKIDGNSSSINNNNHIYNGSFDANGITVHQLEARPQFSEDSVNSGPSGTFDANGYHTDRSLDYETHEDDDDDDDDDADDDDDDDDEMDEMWRQLDHNKVVLTLTTMSRIKDDLEAEKITWSQLRRQRL